MQLRLAVTEMEIKILSATEKLYANDLGWFESWPSVSKHTVELDWPLD